jgi:alpha/beta superfamily hydrolase
MMKPEYRTDPDCEVFAASGPRTQDPYVGLRIKTGMHGNDSILGSPQGGTSSLSAIRSFFLEGPAGRLEALLNAGSADALFATIVCHPHPKGGGTMHNKVVYHATKTFSALGWPVLRFNFRGTGLSEGEHDGRAEIEDVRVALDWLASEFSLPIIAAGFSFGAAMGLKAASQDARIADARIAGFAALGLPTEAEGRHYHYPFLPECVFPKLFLSGDRDQYAPANQIRDIVATALEPKRLVLVPGADHFFTGHLPAMQSALSDWLQFTFLNGSGTGDTAGIPSRS